MSGSLIILPNSLGGPIAPWMPATLSEKVQLLDGVICESFPAGRRFLQQFQGLKLPPHQIPLSEMKDLHLDGQLKWLLEPITQGQTWGLLTDAGMPCIADPGYHIVAYARKKGIPIEVIPGPSAPMLALILSGLPAQSFTFHGYPPKGQSDRAQWLSELAEGHTHICIEAPYRNSAFVETALTALPPDAMLCLAQALLTPEQQVISQRVSRWAKADTAVSKDHPAVFVIYKAPKH